jgi:hypothetical protein
MLADMFQFENVRSAVMKAVKDSTITPIEKISLCYKHNLQREWAREFFVNLCKRQESLSSTEMASIGFGFSAILAKAREDYLGHRHRRLGLDLSDDEKFAMSIVTEARR